MSVPVANEQTWNRDPASLAAEINQSNTDQQNAVFAAALAKGKAHPELIGVAGSGAISQAQYDAAMAAQPKTPSTTKVAMPTPLTSQYLASTEFYGDLGYDEYGGSYAVPDVPEGYKVTEVTKDPTSDSLNFTLAPIESPALQQAKAMTDTYELMALKSGAQQGTKSGINGVLPMVSPTTGLNAEDLAAYNQWKTERDSGRIADLGLFIAAGAIAPVLGPVGVVKAAGVGVGVAQAMKTGFTALEGGDVTQSLLTPSEAIEAAEFGVIFGGADKLVNTGLTAYGGQVGGKIAGAIPTVSAAEKIGFGGAKIGVETVTGTTIMSGVQYAKTGKLTTDDVLMNAGFAAGFSVMGRGVGYVGSKVPHPTIEGVTSRLMPKRSYESALYDRAVLGADTSKSVGSQSWIKELTAKTSTNPTERTLYDRVVIQGNAKPVTPFSLDAKIGGSKIGKFQAKITGKGDTFDLYNRVTNQGTTKGTKGTKRSNGKGGSIISASNFEVTTRASPKNWVSQSLIVKPKSAAKQKMKPFNAELKVETKTLSLPIRDFTKGGIAKLKPKTEAVLETPRVVVDQVGVKALTESKLKGKATAAPSYEWQGMTGKAEGVGKIDTPFAWKGASFYKKRSRVVIEDTAVYASTLPPISKTIGGYDQRGGFGLNLDSHNGITPAVRGGQDVGLKPITDTGSIIDAGFKPFVDTGQDAGLTPILDIGQDTGPIETQEYRVTTDGLLDMKSKGKTKRRGLLDLDFDLGLTSKRSRTKDKHKQADSMYPILTGADVLKSFLNKSNKSTKRRGKK